MLGDPASIKNQGIIFRAVSKLFETKEEIETSTKGTSKVSIHVEMLEIYNDKVRDLLHPSSRKKNQTGEVKLKIASNEAMENIIVEAERPGEILEFLNVSQKRRCVKSTKSNTESSRSHLLFTLYFTIQNESNPRMNRSSKLHICDLAGSERLAKSGSCSVR